MNVSFANKSFDARHLIISAGNLKPKDILSVDGVWYMVESVQLGCVSISSNARFTSILLKDEFNRLRDARELQGKLEVYRPRKVA